MAENPFQTILNPNASRAGLYDMRMMSAANRSEAPFERGIRSSYSGRGRSGGGLLSGMSGIANEPDYSAFTYDPAMRQQAIDAGVTPLEASQVRSNAILPNTGFFGNHPRLSGALEGGMFALANAHGGNTTGESIQGAMEGVIGGQRERQGILREQFARPFEAASMLEGLRDRAQTRELHEMEIQHLRAENQKLGRPDHDFRAFGVSRNDPTIATVDSTTGKVTTVTNPDYDPSQARSQTLQGDLELTTREQLRADGIEPGQATAAQIRAASQRAQANRERPPRSLVAVPDGKGGVTYEEASPGKHFTSVPETPSQAGGEPGKIAAHRQSWIQKQLDTPGPIWISAEVSPGDKDTAQKLGRFYDEYIAPGMQQQSPGGGTSGVKTFNPETGKLE